LEISNKEKTFNNTLLENLTNKQVIAKSIIWNLMGKLLPMGIAVFTIPFIINGFGTERFGLLTIIWMIIGYASIFDLGLGRALTQLLSKKLGEKDTSDLSTLIWTASILLFCLGIFGSLILVLCAKLITVNLLKVSSSYIIETINSIYILALCIPMLFLSNAFNGLLNSFQKFGIINLINAPLALFNYISPLIILPFTHNLAVVVFVLVMGRLITFIAYFIACSKNIPNFTKISFKNKYIKPLINFGGWITVSNIISPLMVSFDRFFIANSLSVSVVAFYTTPYEIIAKMLLIPQSVTNVMFPAFTTELVRNRERAIRMYFKSIKYLFAILIIPVITIVLFAKIGLSLWINPDFAQKSYRIAQILSVGVLINGLAFVPYSLVQAHGKSDITAKFHLIELIIYLFLLFILINNLGIVGAAIAWFVRVIGDFFLLSFYAYKIINKETNIDAGVI